MTDIETRDMPLNWEVFVTPGIPVETLDLPPGTQQRVFSPISATLIYGYSHWIWWIIRPAPANAFQAGFLLTRLYR